MPKLPHISGKKAVKALGKAGFVVFRQTGSHMIVRLTDTQYICFPVPNHREIKIGTLLSIIKCSGLTGEQFLALL